MPDLDLERRLHGVDRARMPDLLPRAREGASSDGPWAADIEPPGRRRLIAAATALAVAAAAIGVLVWTYDRGHVRPLGTAWTDGFVGTVLPAPDSIPGIENSDLMAIDPRTGLRLDITPTPQAEHDPAWSPNGSKVAFMRTTTTDGGRHLQTDVFAMNVDGRDLRRLRTCHSTDCSIRDMTWSPDNVHLAWVRRLPGNSYPMVVEVIDTRTGAVTRICDEARCDQALGMLAWSPDGTRLAFAKDESGFIGLLAGPLPGAVWVATLEGSVRQITEGRDCIAKHDTCLYDSNPEWSPDGVHLLFHREGQHALVPRNGASQGSTTNVVLVATADGTPVRSIEICRSCQVWEPRWSGDGTSILLGSDHNDLLVADASTGAVHRVPVHPTADCPSPVGIPSWSPDGRLISFEAGDRRTDNLCAVAARGGRPQLVVADPAAEDHATFGGYTWLPRPATLLGAPSGAPSPIPPVPSGPVPVGTLYFTTAHGSVEEDASHIWSISAGDPTPRPVAAGGAYAYDLALSPDGSHLAFHANNLGRGRAQIWSMAVDGSDRVQLTAFRWGATEPAWSPDGSQIAFIAENGKGVVGGLYVMRADGTGQRLVVPGNIFYPGWTPNGSGITFEQEGNHGADDLATVDLATGDVTRTVDLTGAQSNPSWSPDGSTLAFWWSTGYGDAGLYLVDANGSNVRRVPGTNIAGEDHIAWSPDGRWLAFEGATDTHGPEVYVVRTDGGDLHQVTSMPGFVDHSSVFSSTGDPVWGPSAG